MASCLWCHSNRYFRNRQGLNTGTLELLILDAKKKIIKTSVSEKNDTTQNACSNMFFLDSRDLIQIHLSHDMQGPSIYIPIVTGFGKEYQKSLKSVRGSVKVNLLIVRHYGVIYIHCQRFLCNVHYHIRIQEFSLPSTATKEQEDSQLVTNLLNSFAGRRIKKYICYIPYHIISYQIVSYHISIKQIIC